MLQPTSHEDGTTAPVTGPAAKFSRTPTRVRHGAPALGAHTEELLEEIGIDAAARKRLREAKII
jgi:formyl-CoA transferase